MDISNVRVCDIYEIKIEQPSDIAAYLVFRNSFNTKRVLTAINKKKTVNFDRNCGNRIYDSNRRIFDNLYKIIVKYEIDIFDYLDYFLENYDIRFPTLEKYLLDMGTIQKYCKETILKRTYINVYEYILKSIDNIVIECIQKGYNDVREYILIELIGNNRLVEKYLSGRISMYYIALVPNMDKYILEQINPEYHSDFKYFLDHIYELKETAIEAIKYKAGNRDMIGILSFTNKQIQKTTQQQQTENI